ncbi:E3 ubiquitin-protein ligase RHF2A [Camellia lanceoleosa]|uniref:E3 ubiquitin-protein ligase RHF2A n=1 Tax=Camellia lanceoleosa TaxID=1840588 RepID=A0ACC0H936_9ERIC|nr:E3 ubiquitin-protein ligase RHF2A [Camellia lanceoleosa]
MCWQSISLKDPSSQELLEAVERERSFKFNPSRNSTIFHHPTLGFSNYSIYQLVQMMQSLKSVLSSAGAAAMGRAHHHIARRDGPRSQSSVHGRPQFMGSGPQKMIVSGGMVKFNLRLLPKDLPETRSKATKWRKEVVMKCRDRLHELVKEEIDKKDSSAEEWKIVMDRSFNRMDNEVIAWNDSVLRADCRDEINEIERIESSMIQRLCC